MICIKHWTFLKRIGLLCSSWRKSPSDKQKRSHVMTPVRYDVEVHMLTDIGCHRDVNEDCIQYVKPGDIELVATKGMLGIVADGMGGHAAGEVASELAVDAVSRLYYQDEGEPTIALKKSLEEANRIIYETALKDEHLQGMGTTCTALVLKNGMAYVAHVGDSRLYLLRNGSLFLMTEDHTIVMQMVKAGLLTAEESRSHPAKNVIVRALGTRPTIEVAMGKDPIQIREGDLFILCSDGLYDMVEETEMKEILLSLPIPVGCERLIALARERGGYDNITVGLLRVKPAGSQTAQNAPDTRGAHGPRQ
jgi:serine/threonine protein phosphatase PrpC